MDPASLAVLIGPLVAGVATYLRHSGATRAGDKIADQLGEKAGDALATLGAQTLQAFRNRFRKNRDRRAEQALDRVAEAPDDPRLQQQLIEETVRVAASDSDFAQELIVLADRLSVATSGGVVINNDAPNEGAQGVFNAPVTFTRKN